MIAGRVSGEAVYSYNCSSFPACFICHAIEESLQGGAVIVFRAVGYVECHSCTNDIKDLLRACHLSGLRSRN